MYSVHCKAAIFSIFRLQKIVVIAHNIYNFVYIATGCPAGYPVSDQPDIRYNPNINLETPPFKDMHMLLQQGGGSGPPSWGGGNNSAHHLNIPPQPPPR